MKPNQSLTEGALLAELRRRRAELLESMSVVEHALAGPAPGLQTRWAEGVHIALVELSASSEVAVANAGRRRTLPVSQRRPARHLRRRSRGCHAGALTLPDRILRATSRALRQYRVTSIEPTNGPTTSRSETGALTVWRLALGLLC